MTNDEPRKELDRLVTMTDAKRVEIIVASGSVIWTPSF